MKRGRLILNLIKPDFWFEQAQQHPVQEAVHTSVLSPAEYRPKHLSWRELAPGQFYLAEQLLIVSFQRGCWRLMRLSLLKVISRDELKNLFPSWTEEAPFNGGEFDVFLRLIRWEEMHRKYFCTYTQKTWYTSAGLVIMSNCNCIFVFWHSWNPSGLRGQLQPVRPACVGFDQEPVARLFWDFEEVEGNEIASTIDHGSARSEGSIWQVCQKIWHRISEDNK